ncbi:probable phosphoglycerate mutase [Paracoccus halophilus]|uniref:Probable phosphoglycerate mutase n=1 Tax=Paracoccus halophilus TaxID=376733 RepID=A0A1I0TB59_9RHOB|nr:histidine phosphatase family protein [Paracoccus halophilus]SFA48950.1 probable phosphoglycerate mutase [Paracoccus halophilus]
MVTLPAGAFLFLRHGETRANAEDVICGRTDLPLNPTGINQARQAAQYLAGTELAGIVVSPMLRARQTAQPVAAMLGLTPCVLPALAERDWGAWEGLPRAMLRRDETPPDGESPADFAARIRAGFAGIDLSRPLLIVAHSGTARELHSLLAGTPPPRLVNAQIVMWRPVAGGWQCHECFKPTL